jgi:type I restriction enzyme S subunit
MELKPGYKQTEVGMIPQNWDVIDLSNLCILQRGFDITEATRVAGTVPVYSSSGFSYFHNKAMVLPPGVVTGRKGILGKVFFIEEPFWPHDTTLWVKDFKGNHPGYVALVLKNFHLERLDAATSVPTLNRNNLGGYRIPHPRNKAEQEAIAETLKDVEGLIGALDKLIAKKRDLKQAAMQQLLTGKQRLPGFNAEWTVKRWANIAPLQRGFDLPSPQLRQGPYPVVYSNGVLNHHSAFQVKGPGVVTGRSGTIGKVTFVAQDYWPHNTSLWVTDFKGNDPKFIFYFLTSIGLERFGTGSGVPTLNRNDVHSYNVNFPPSAIEQTAIATVLSDMDAELAALKRRQEKTRALKQAIVQELLTGRTRLISPKEAHA